MCELNLYKCRISLPFLVSFFFSFAECLFADAQMTTPTVLVQVTDYKTHAGLAAPCVHALVCDVEYICSATLFKKLC